MNVKFLPQLNCIGGLHIDSLPFHLLLVVLFLDGQFVSQILDLAFLQVEPVFKLSTEACMHDVFPLERRVIKISFATEVHVLIGFRAAQDLMWTLALLSALLLSLFHQLALDYFCIVFDFIHAVENATRSKQGCDLLLDVGLELLIGHLLLSKRLCFHLRVFAVLYQFWALEPDLTSGGRPYLLLLLIEVELGLLDQLRLVLLLRFEVLLELKGLQ